MKIALAQQNYHIGNFEDNTRKIIEAIQQAEQQGAELVVFPELSICGYPPRDFLEFEDFINKCYEAIDAIKQHTHKTAAVVGSPARNPLKEGKDLFNAAWMLYEGEVKAIVAKTCLPTYDIFDEYRYFEPAYEWKTVPFKGRNLAITVCEDIWNLGDNPLYRLCPMDKLIEQRPDIMINLSASPFDYDHDDDRKEIIRANVLKYKLPMVYCNGVGSQTEVVFDGGSLVFDRKGNIIKELAYFTEDFQLAEVPEHTWPDDDSEQMPAHKETWPQDHGSTTPWHHSAHEEYNRIMQVSKVKDPEEIIRYLTQEKNIAEIYQALLSGIRDYFRKMGFKKAILGSSGGIDSAVTLVIACEALGKENVRAVLMPSQYSSGHSVSDAEQLSKNLGNPYDIIAIENIYNSFLGALKPVFKDAPFNVAEENLQSRTRGNLLMAIANKFGYILLNTSNKSELATGYGTLYGDMAGGLSVLGDVYKMQVYALANYLNSIMNNVIPHNIIEKPPSAELRDNQKDSDSLPEYHLLDKVLYQYIERRQGPKEIIGMGIDKGLVDKVLKLVNTNEYKRNQFCPIIRVSSKAFGIGRRMPIVGKYLS
jgi:NAD+ synthase (glutamine-hydrolysing)